MDIPDRRITELELRRHDGETETRKWVAFENIVYDVTDCPRWKKELHENLHYPGLDLTTELPEAPHEEDVFTRPCVIVIGMLQIT